MANAREKQLGHYSIQRQLGAGGMGEVFLADDTRLGRKVAIKLLPAAMTQDETAKRRLLREARAAAALDHPNVCTVYEVGEHDDRLFVAMQYVDGETLGELAARSTLTLTQALDITTQIASALQEAHSHGLVHRDIKPANIMINSRGQVKVLDFGLAKAVGPERSDHQTTEMLVSQTGAIVGTAPYMSPEQIRGEQLDRRSDLFSLGVMLYEIAAGMRPFDRPSAVATITSILFDAPPPLRAAEFKPLEPVIERCLAKRREDRYASAAELIRDLNHVAGGQMTARPSSDTLRGRQMTTPAADPEVEQLVIKGRLQWNKRHLEAVKQGIVLFQEAVERDPSSARAYAGLADSYLMLAFLQTVPPIEMLPRIKAAAMRAIELEPSLAEPHATLGYAAGLYEWDWEVTEREMREAIRLDPKYPWPPHWFGILLAGRGRFDEAIKEARKARDLDALSPIITVGVGIPYHYARRYEEALEIYHRVVETDPGFAPTHYYIALTYEQLGNYQRAIEHFDRCAQVAGRTSFFYASLAHCYAVSGNVNEARRELADLYAQRAHRYVSPLNFALVEFALGDLDAGFENLEASFAERSGTLFLLGVEPRYDVVRDDPRFRALAAKYGLPASVTN